MACLEEGLMTNTEEFDGEILEVAIEASDEQPQVIAETETDEIEEDNGQSRLLVLTRGRSERENPSRLVETQGTDDGRHKLLVLPDENGAIGIYINLLEQHGFKEQATLNALQDVIDVSSWKTWRDALTLNDRKERLLNQAQDRAHRSPHVERYLENGSWRTVKNTDTIRSVADQLYDGITPNPRECYRNTIVALNALEDLDRLRYIEGMALPKQGGRAIAHAWLELDGSVIELTWPWHAPIPPSETVYYGVPVDTDEVLETTRQRNAGFNPLFLTLEEIVSG